MKLLKHVLLFAFILTSCSNPTSLPALPPHLTTAQTVTLVPTASIHSTSTVDPTKTVTASPIPTRTALPSIDVSFYMIRLEYVTTSDWTRLQILDAPNILSYTIREINGNPYEAAVYADSHGSYRIELNRPVNAIKDEPSASMVIDFVFSADPPPGKVRVIQDKGALNYSTIKILLLQLDEQVLLQDFSKTREHSEIIVDLSLASQNDPKKSSIEQVTSPKMLWAVYYPWYRGDNTGWGGWQDPMYTDHPIDHYSSANRTSVENQIQLAQSAGLDGFIVSFSGQGEPDTQCFRHLLDYSAETGFRIAFMVEAVDFSALNTGGEPKGAAIARTKDWIRDIVTNYGENPAYMRVNDKPLVLLFGTSYTAREIWQQIFSELESEGITATYWGQGYNALDDYAGFFEYGVPENGDLSGAYSSFDRLLTYRPLFGEDNKPKLWAASVMPGFDNTPLVRWFGEWPFSQIPREDGGFYRTTFDHAINSRADWIVITSWNEFQENSHIEPSEQFGDKYLNITSEYAKQWKLP
jgi:hypothetical protein